jgi:hypothetical protein
MVQGKASTKEVCQCCGQFTTHFGILAMNRRDYLVCNECVNAMWQVRGWASKNPTDPKWWNLRGRYRARKYRAQYIP